MEPVNLRDLERIREQQPGSSLQLGTLLLGSLGLSAVLLVGLMNRRAGEVDAARPDPLAELVSQVKQEHAEQAAPDPSQLGADQVTFPALLSDHAEPTTALVAVQDQHGRLLPQTAASQPGIEPPPAEDRLRVAPLPAGDLLSSTAVTQRPKDSLTRLAAEAGKPDAQLAEAGREGGYQLQVASFRSQAEAQALVQQLRRRDHHAHTETAEIRDRGTWYRVRIGPFKSRQAAQGYKTSLEARERLTTILVDPEQVERQNSSKSAPKLVIRETATSQSTRR